MADLEKTMRGLEICVERRVSCAECPYWEGDIICLNRHSLLADALALLREQDERIKFLEKWIAYLEGGDPYEGNGVMSHD